MATNQPHLELRSTGFYWRRRVPSAVKNRFIPRFFCFPLRTHVPRDAANLAQRLTAVSEICFKAEQNMLPEIMTEILVAYVRSEIELADRLRALTGPRTREAAEAALTLEAASRASLHDAIFLCDKTPAVQPLKDTAERLGIPLDETEEDFAILADKMVRAMIAVSEERERRTRGVFNEQDPNVAEALLRMGSPQSSVAMPAAPAPAAPARIHSMQQLTSPSSDTPDSAVCTVEAPPADLSISCDEESGAQKTAGKQQDLSAPAKLMTSQPMLVVHQLEGRTISLKPERLAPVHVLDATDPSVLDLWDEWFNDNKAGLRIEGAYVHEDAGKAARFMKDADTIRSTRKIIADVFGETRVSKMTSDRWVQFNDLLQKLPNNHGRSSRLRALTCYEFIDHEKAKEKKLLAKAEKQIKKEGLAGEEAEAIRKKVKIKVIAPRTFQRHQKYLSAPLDHAVEKGRISHNPFKPFVLRDAVIDDMRASLPDNQRKLWTSNEFAALLSTDKWTSPKTKIDDHVYWVPLIALLHAMRSEEILQLKPSNIRCHKGVYFFDIERGTGQSIKSNNARRFVPIHSQLIELGFLKLVEQQTQLGKNRIFARVARSKCSRLTYTKNFTKNFAYYRKSRNAYRERQDLHSMRTTFNSERVAMSMPDTARRYLMGHRNDDVGIINYLPEGFPLATLKDYIEMEQLDLSMVTRRFGADPENVKGPRLAAQDGIAVSA